MLNMIDMSTWPENIRDAFVAELESQRERYAVMCDEAYYADRQALDRESDPDTSKYDILSGRCYASRELADKIRGSAL